MPPRIKRITAFPVRVPVPRERVNCPAFHHHMLHRQTTSGGKDGGYVGSLWFGDVPFFVIKVESDGGPAGWSDSSRLIDRDLFIRCAKAFIGWEPSQIDPRRPMLDVSEQVAEMRRVGRQVVHPCKGIENAMLAWRARVEDVPLWRLFGPKVRDALRVEYWSGHRTPAGAAEVTRQALQEQFLGLKLKVNAESDVAGVVRAVYSVAPPSFTLNLDPNGQWDLSSSLAFAKAMVQTSPNTLLEDPIYGDIEKVAQVRRETGVKIGLTVTPTEWVERAESVGAADCYNIGGTWHQVFAVADLVTKVGKPFWLGSGLETGLSDLFAVHFGCTQPNCTIGSDLFSHAAREDDLVLQPIPHMQGHIPLPDGPGLGVDVDLAAIEKFRCAEPIVVT